MRTVRSGSADRYPCRYGTPTTPSRNPRSGTRNLRSISTPIDGTVAAPRDTRLFRVWRSHGRIHHARHRMLADGRNRIRSVRPRSARRRHGSAQLDHPRPDRRDHRRLPDGGRRRVARLDHPRHRRRGRRRLACVATRVRRRDRAEHRQHRHRRHRRVHPAARGGPLPGPGLPPRLRGPTQTGRPRSGGPFLHVLPTYAAPMHVRRSPEVEAFLAAAGDFLAAREAEHNLIFGICASLRETPEIYTDRVYLAVVVDESDRVVGAAIQTPPFRLVLSEIDDPRIGEALALDTLDLDLPGVAGPAGEVEAFVAARVAAGGRSGHVRERDRIFRLETVRPPRAIAGSRRIAGREDRDLVFAWLEGFMVDAFGHADLAEVESMTERWIERRGRTLHLWIDGEPVSMCGIGGQTPRGIRIGPVYTPPAARGRGYASALVAAVSQEALDAGRRFCFLFTDAANPTSNHIYQEIGYEHVRDVDIYEFDRS